MLESLFYTSTLFKITFFSFILSFLAYLGSMFIREDWFSKLPRILFILAFAACTALIAERWIEAGRPPFKSFYESLVFAAWTTALVSLAADLKYRVKLFGLLATASILALFVVALLKRDAETAALPPALQTWMFIPHVISYFLAYGALFAAGFAAVLYLVKPAGIGSHHTLGNQARIDFGDLTYQITKFGFLFLTIGLLLGAWWGQEAWSNYWAWDPKENWAFITWLIFAAYLHFRNIGTWTKKRLSWVVIIGVLAILFTYMGMDYLPTANESLHIYSAE